MARIVGVEIPNEKRVDIALTYIFGIGPTTSKKILSATQISPEIRVKDLSSDEINRIVEFLDKFVPTEGQVRQKVFRDIKRKRDIRSYQGVRHKKNLPVRGQNTRKNARTKKGKGKTIANKKKATH